MKKLIFLLLIVAGNTGYSQVLKKLGDKVKGEVEWRAQRKAGQKIDQGIDSLLAQPKKIVDKKKVQKQQGGKAENNTVQAVDEKQTASNTSSKNKKQNPSKNIKTVVPDETDMTPTDGFITLKLSADKIFTNGGLLISGESVKYKTLSQVEVKVAGPSGTDIRKITLTTDGKYHSGWNASEVTGEFTVTVTSSDKKSTESAIFIVEELETAYADDWPADNTREIKRAMDRLEDAADKVKGDISAKNKAELEKKMSKAKEKMSDALQMFKNLGKANKEMIKMVKKGKGIPPNLAGNLSELNNLVAGQATEMKKINDIADHKPQDNTICEYLVMLNEACAAFSTFTNVFTKSLGTAIKNIALDKGVPKVVGTVNEAAGGISDPYDFPLKEASKIYATSKFDAQSLTEKLGKAGIAGDIMQFATDVLIKIYCEVFKGSFTHDYNIDFRNSLGQTWWSYGVGMKAALTLRYPKKDISSSVIKLKGNIEGNATKFSFFGDVSRDDGFFEGSKGKIEVVPIKVFTPLSVPLANTEIDVLGFGAIARGLATPASFNIIIEAEYDVDADKIKIFVKHALIDFMPWIANQYVFILFGGDLIPWIKKMTFPIHKARLTINGVVSDNNEFTVKKDATGNLSFEGKGNRHIGDAASVRETDMNFTISAKKE